MTTNHSAEVQSVAELFITCKIDGNYIPDETLIELIDNWHQSELHAQAERILGEIEKAKNLAAYDTEFSYEVGELLAELRKELL